MGVGAAGQGGLGNISQYRVGNWWVRYSWQDVNNIGYGRGTGRGRVVEGNDGSASGMSTST